ncbi:MAG: hydrogen peroxide-inducible genes activator [Gammaproteobacteria bacterium]|jgi:LysR family hydrogen peroxide-inducible transcriptional activator|nr:hydrogen peroxide-inducible genes activator [Gammaproteobacteria bacterium]MDH5172997.1 hydrogen peroxide-inducible genes activator [Gammaproteobacteria bacterium]
MQKLPSVRQLQYFVALAELGHFGRAAEACFVSQSAFSTAIQELEQTLGAQLVDRTNRKVIINSAGREVAAQARICLRELQAITRLAGDSTAPLAGKLVLGVIPTIGPFLLPPLMKKLRRTFPELRLYLKEQRSDELVAGLQQGAIDLLLLALPYPLKNVETQVLFRDSFLLACRKGTTLVDPAKFSVDQLNPESVLLLEDGHCLRDHAVSACHIRELDKVNRFAASSLHTLLEMVESDLGITFVPAMARDSALLRGTHIATYPVRSAGHRDIALVWRKGSSHGEGFRTLGNFIRENH